MVRGTIPDRESVQAGTGSEAARWPERIEFVAVPVDPGACHRGPRSHPKGHLTDGAAVIAKEGSHHAVLDPGVIVEPRFQVIDQLDSCIAVAGIDLNDELPHPLARKIVLVSMPTQGAVPGGPHQPLLVREVLLYACVQPLSCAANRRR